MSGDEITVTIGWIGRHTPKGAGAGGRDAAILDIAQDLLLRELHYAGALDALVFKGGTALRKLYAGNQGRFSLDLDFSLAAPANPETVVLDLVGSIDGRGIGPFSYGVSERRGKWSVTVTSPFNDAGTVLSSKLDVSPPVWLDPARRGWVPMPVHATYGDRPLPLLQVVRMEENLAEKISDSTALPRPGTCTTSPGSRQPRSAGRQPNWQPCQAGPRRATRTDGPLLLHRAAGGLTGFAMTRPPRSTGSWSAGGLSTC